MRKDDWGAFSALIRTADELTLGKPRSGEAIGLLFQVLLDYELADVRNAVSQHMKESKFAVTPSDIISRIDGDKEDLSAVAWRLFLRAIDRWGYYDSVRFPDPAYHYVIEQLGGWLKLSTDYHELTDKEIEFRRKEWVRLYEIGLRVASWNNEPGKVMVPGILHGFHELNNSTLGRLDMLSRVISISTGDIMQREELGLTERINMPQLRIIGGGVV